VVDRIRERTALLAAADRARAGTAQIVTLEGEAGSGKTWLLREIEAALTDFSADPATTGPLLRIIDDADELDASVTATHWRDLHGLRKGRVLVIVAARTGASPLVAKLKPTSSRADRGAVLELVGFTPQQTIELAAERGIAALAPTRAHILAELTDGNPLHLVKAFDDLGQRLHVSVPRSLPAPESFTAELDDTLNALSTPGRALVELLAVVEDPIAISSLVSIAERAGIDVSFDDGLESGLVHPFNDHGQRELTLRSARVRSAVRRSLNPTARRALHAATADAFVGWPRLEHLLHATEHTDDALAAELEAEGERIATIGRYHEAARMYGRASGVSSVTLERERRLQMAGALSFYADDAEFASTLSPSIARCTPSLGREMVLGGIGYLLGDFHESLSLVQRALTDYEGGSDGLDPHEHFTAAVVASLELAVVDLPATITRSTVALAAHSAGPGEVLTAAEARLRITDGFALWIANAVDASDKVLAPVIALPLTRPERADALTIYAQREFYRGDAAHALATVDRALESARASTALHIIPLCIALRSHILFSLGQWDSALLDAQAVLAHTTTSRNGNHDVLAHSTIAMISANSGELEYAERSVRVARRLGVERPLPQHTTAAAIAAAVVEREGGHPHAVVHALAPLSEGFLEVGLTSTGFTGWRAMQAEALIALGSYDRARTIIAVFENEKCIKYFGYPDWLHGLLAEAEGDLGHAITAYQRAIDTGDESSTPFSHALALRSLGRALSARGDVTGGTAALRAADRLFTRLGAIGHLPKTEDVVGGLDALNGWATLTPREHDTSMLASEGMLNREIAAAMHVSVKTVEHHLANSLAKLGLRSRRDLERAAGRGNA